MAKYSQESDMKDELIKQFSKRCDHIEAEDYVDKVLSKLGIESANVEVTPLLKELAVCYATYKRAFYESKSTDDMFYQKYKEYEKALKELTADVMRAGNGEDAVKAGSKIFAQSFRG